MKHYLILIFSLSYIASCIPGRGDDSENNISSKISYNKSESEIQQDVLFNELLNIQNELDQFEGTASVGNANGKCFMLFTQNSQGDKISMLRYQINNYIAGKSEQVDETFKISNIQRKSGKKDGFGLNNSRDFEDIFLHANLVGMKASVNKSQIRDSYTSGSLKLLIDSVDHELQYTISAGNCWYTGKVKLEIEQYLKLKTLFMNDTLSDEEIKNIKQSIKFIELASNNSNFINLGNDQYKVLITKNQLINNQNLKPLFCLKIKNISDKKIYGIKLDELYDTAPSTSYSNSSRDQGINPLSNEVFKGSSLSKSSEHLYFSDKKEEEVLRGYFSNLPKNRQEVLINSLKDEVGYSFSMKFTKPGYWFNYASNRSIDFKNMSVTEILDHPSFLNKWNKINRYPAITISLYDIERDAWTDSQIKIYFELTDSIINTENDYCIYDEMLRKKYDLEREKNIEIIRELNTEYGQMVANDLKIYVTDNDNINDKAKEKIISEIGNGTITIEDVKKMLTENDGKKVKIKNVKKLIKKASEHDSNDSNETNFESEIELIKDKLINSGYESLSDSEKEILSSSFKEVSAEFPGGQIEMMKYLRNNINYPETALKDGKTGKVFIRYTVNKTGRITNVKILKGVREDLDNEALRVVNIFPKHRPASINGVFIETSFTIPINFILD